MAGLVVPLFEERTPSDEELMEQARHICQSGACGDPEAEFQYLREMRDAQYQRPTK